MPERTIHFETPRLLHQLYCGNEQNLALVENSLGVRLITRDDWLQVEGDPTAIDKVEALFDLLKTGRGQGISIGTADFHNILQSFINGHGEELADVFAEPLVLQFKRRSVVPKTINQKRYVQVIQKCDIVFGIGPAGTGKTYLAMACGINALFKEEVERLILTRPAVEAGEALGFLPGDLKEKIQPYLRPLYDAMYDILGQEHSQKLIERNIIEIAPLAYMRGRTLSNSFIILDEAQNTTPEQMMMFLTRMGDRSRMVVTGDLTQIDLPRKINSGLKRATEVLADVGNLAFLFLEGRDVVRHPIVQEIIEAYEDYSRGLDS